MRSEAPCGPDGMLRVTELLDPYFSNTVKGILSISQLTSESSFLLPAVFSLPLRSPRPPLPFFPPKSASESPSPPKKWQQQLLPGKGGERRGGKGAEGGGGEAE